MGEGVWEADEIAPLAHDPEVNTISGMFMRALQRMPVKKDVLVAS